MQLIRCTSKLQKEMGLKRANLSTSSSGYSYLGQWHSNLIYINRRKCILFINDKTLFHFIIPDISRSEIRNLAQIFKQHLSCVLFSEGLKKELVEQILSDYSEIEFGMSNDRRVLGNLNDLAFHYEYRVLNCGGVQSAAVPLIIHELNRMPMKRDSKMIFPIDELFSVLKITT